MFSNNTCTIAMGQCPKVIFLSGNFQIYLLCNGKKNTWRDEYQILTTDSIFTGWGAMYAELRLKIWCNHFLEKTWSEPLHCPHHLILIVAKIVSEILSNPRCNISTEGSENHHQSGFYAGKMTSSSAGLKNWRFLLTASPPLPPVQNQKEKRPNS